MSYDKGIGTCLVPVNGIPCGRQIEDGESIRNLTLPYGGAIVGHKQCVDSYEANKQKENDMVQRVDQGSPGGPVDMRTAKDALLGSVPLVPKEEAHTGPSSLSEVPMPDGVRSVAEVPFEEPAAEPVSVPTVAAVGDDIMRLTLRVQAIEDTLRAFLTAGEYLRNG